MSQHILISLNFIRGKISVLAVTPDLVDVIPVPSQAHVRVRMSDTVSSALVVPASSCVNVSVTSPMPAFAGRPAAPLLIFRFHCGGSGQVRRSFG